MKKVSFRQFQSSLLKYYYCLFFLNLQIKKPAGCALLRGVAGVLRVLYIKANKGQLFVINDFFPLKKGSHISCLTGLLPGSRLLKSIINIMHTA